MHKLTLITAGAIVAIFAATSIQPARAGESDFKGYTKMPAASNPKPYNPARGSSSSPFKGFTTLPAGSSQSTTSNRSSSNKK